MFPYVFTTYRLTEHHTAGGMSRWLPYLSELQPEFFCEVSPELAARARARARRLGDDRHARGPRSRRGCWSPTAVAPLTVGGRTVHQIGLPYHWGSANGSVTGDSANDLFGVTLDPNVHIQESKALACDIQPGRRPTGPALLALRRGVPQRARASPIETGNAHARPQVDVQTADRPGPARRVERGMAGYAAAAAAMGFFTDTSICIGCKACEVACKEWNGVPEDGLNLLGSSYDNTGALGARTWRHVAFIEQQRRSDRPVDATPSGLPARTDDQSSAG